MSLQDCNLLFNFLFLYKNKNDVFYLGEKLVFKEWKFEFYKALFSSNSLLVINIDSNNDTYNNNIFYCIKIKDFILYYILYFTNRNKFMLKKEHLTNKVNISTLISNYIKYKRYYIPSKILFGSLRKKYKNKYKQIKEKKLYIKFNDI